MKNNYEIRGNVTAVFVKHKGIEYETLIDTEDLEIVQSNPNTWHAKETRKNGDLYVKSAVTENGIYKTLILHRLVLGDPVGMVVDHINHNTLDNRKSNLRGVTNQFNSMNRKGATSVSKSGYRGVYWENRRACWIAQIKINGRLTRLGSFITKEEANAAVESALKNIGVS